MSRQDDIELFYELLDSQSRRQGGARPIRDLRNAEIPLRGVYFFFEPDEDRQHSGKGQRIVRVGTHALNRGSSSSLRQRLMQHSGGRSGSGNHRGSIFRLLVGQALIARGIAPGIISWGLKGAAGQAAAALGESPSTIRSREAEVEQEVSRYLSRMTVLLLGIGDEASPESQRAYVERNSIALLSNHRRPAIDPASPAWLGRSSDRSKVRESGLWNQRHVEENYDGRFLKLLEALVAG